MANQDRKPYESRTVLDQDFLDECHDNLVNQLEMVVDIDRAPTLSGVTFDHTTNSLTTAAVEAHLPTGEEIELTTTGTLPAGLSTGVRYYIISTSGGGPTFKLSATYGGGEIVLSDNGTGTHTLQHDFFIRASDRNKYVGGIFYEAMLRFPVISKTIGELLSPELEFSTLGLEITNVDGRLNDILAAGDDFNGWIGRDVEVRIGLRDVESTYTTIFKGKITEEGGFGRSVSSVRVTARSDFDRLNEVFPQTVFTKTPTTFPDIEDSLVNTVVPVIYGDWTTEVEPNVASIPAYPVNGADPDVEGGLRTNILCVISENDNTFFDTSQVYLKRGDKWWTVPPADIVSVTDNRTFEIQQLGSLTPVTPDTDIQILEYSQGDEFFVKVKGKDLGAYDDNLVSQARDILITFAGLSTSDFHSNWDTYRDKSSPAVSSVATIKSRVWIQEPEPALTYVLSMLEQVRLEAFIDRDRKMKLSSLHLEDWEPDPSFELKNWDIARGSLQLVIDDRSNFNRGQGVYNFLPNRNENLKQTAIYRNQAAIDQADGKLISKQIVFPNLYEEATVINQTQELLRIVSSYLEYVNLDATWRSMLLDIGDFVKLNISIQGAEFEEVVSLVRDVGYDPAGIKIPMRLWSFQMLPFPGYSPGYNGIVGGSTASITAEE